MSILQGPTLQMLQEVDGNGKGSLLTFLHGAGLIGTENPAVALTGADLRGVALRRRADLREANLQGAKVTKEQLAHALYLRGATLPVGSEHYPNIGLPRIRYMLTSENPVIAKFSLPHHPGPESLACEGPKYGRVLAVSYVCQGMNPRCST